MIIVMSYIDQSSIEQYGKFMEGWWARWDH